MGSRSICGGRSRGGTPSLDKEVEEFVKVVFVFSMSIVVRLLCVTRSGSCSSAAATKWPRDCRISSAAADEDIFG